MTVYRRAVRPVLFRVGGGDAESAHDLTMRWLVRLGRAPRLLRALRTVPHSPPGAARVVFGIKFPNPVGLAAGMDKDGVALPAWPAMGLGFVEVGTITWHAQPPNEPPRLVRLPASNAIINRMGFNNGGPIALANRLERLGGLAVPLGISLGKSKITPLHAAVEDYVRSLRVLYPYGDYFVVNVSSPNTPGLRQLQDRALLDDLLGAVRAEVRGHATRLGVSGKPILVKVAPDLTDAALGELLQTCADHGVSGIIATNTTTARNGLASRDAPHAAHPGGLSGAPLAERVREVVAFVSRETGGALPIIGVGGVMSPADAVRLFDAGASLVQLYTGLVYHGPALIRSIVRELAASKPG